MLFSAAGCLRIAGEHSGPAVRVAVAGCRRLVAVDLPVPMLEIDTGRVAVGGEADLDLGRMLRAGLPLQDEAVRRLGEDHLAPALLRAVPRDLGEFAIRSGLEHDVDRCARAVLRNPDRVGLDRPPVADAFRERPERVLERALHGDRAPDRLQRRLHTHHELLPPSSVATLKAARASYQK